MTFQLCSFARLGLALAVLASSSWTVATLGAEDESGQVRQSVVPSGAAVYARQVLESDWFGFAGSPTYKKYAGSSVGSGEGVRLGDPFRSLIVRGQMLDAFVRSAETDPVAYASVTQFVFPVLTSNGDDIGAIIVLLNQDEDGEPFVQVDDEYTLGGFILPGSRETESVRMMQIQAPDATVDYVRFVDSGLPQQFVIRYSNGRIMAGEDAANLRPLAENKARVIRHVQSYQHHEGR